MIRVIPTNYLSAMGHMCLRLEAYGCPYDLGMYHLLSYSTTPSTDPFDHTTYNLS